jgi:cyanate lyase
MTKKSKIIDEAKKLIEGDEYFLSNDEDRESAFQTITNKTGASYSYVAKVLRGQDLKPLQSQKQTQVIKLIKKQINANCLSINDIAIEVGVSRAYVYKIIQSDKELDDQATQVRIHQLNKKIYGK